MRCKPRGFGQIMRGVHFIGVSQLIQPPCKADELALFAQARNARRRNTGVAEIPRAGDPARTRDGDSLIGKSPDCSHSVM